MPAAHAFSVVPLQLTQAGVTPPKTYPADGIHHTLSVFEAVLKTEFSALADTTATGEQSSA